jgi:polar amino acid transport system substrate-binding protein
MKTMLQPAVALFVAAITVGAAAQDVPERIKKAGKLVAATQPNYAPISYKDPATNQLMGFDVELGEAIAKELGLKIEWQETAFAQMISSLVTGRVDIVMAGMSDLPGRREQVDFVDYLKSGAQFYTSQANAAAIKTPADLCGKKVGASRSTNWPAQIEEWSKQNCVTKGKPPISVVGTEGSIDARTQLKSGRLDGGVQGSETISYNQKMEPNIYVIVGPAFTESLMGIPTPKTDPQLRDAVKGALERLQKNGTYDQIAAKYGLSGNKLSPIAINQGKD